SPASRSCSPAWPSACWAMGWPTRWSCHGEGVQYRQRSTTMSTTAVPKPIPSLRGKPFWRSLGRLNKDRLGFLQEVVRQSGDVGTFRLGPIRAILINAPHLIQAVLVEHGASFGKTPPGLRGLRLVVGE